MSTVHHDRGPETYTATESQYVAMQDSPEFQDLRRRYRGWVLPVAAGALVWYFLYVALAAYAGDFMGQKLIGNVNVGLVMGLLQFVSTFLVTALYIRHADKSLDPASQRLREKFELEADR